MLIRYLFLWLLLAVVGVANGLLRVATYGQHVSDLAAHQISTATAIGFTGLLVWGFSRIWPLPSARQAWTVGVCWLLMTVAFEFGFGHFVVGHPWAVLLADYNLLRGRVWLLFLVWVTVMPYLLHRIRLRSAPGN